MPRAHGEKKFGYRVSISAWQPEEVERFLVSRGFTLVSQDGDETFWKGRGENGEDAQASFSRTREELTPGTMGDSVMRQSKWGKEHWNYWKCLRKSHKKKLRCCEKFQKAG